MANHPCLDFPTLGGAVEQSGIAFRSITELQPVGGTGDKVFPANYEGATYAWVALEPRRLVFEATSRPRAERGRAMIEALCGGAVAYRATSYEDVGQAAKRRPAPARAAPEIPPEVEAAVVAQLYEEHYRKWLDEPVPALDGRTPREAAGLKSAHPQLISLLKGMENMSDRERRAGRPAYDFAWMWGELGLERPG